MHQQQSQQQQQRAENDDDIIDSPGDGGGGGDAADLIVLANKQQPGDASPMLLERFDYTTGCYAGLDEELFYNAKYESIHDDPAYSMYYTGEWWSL